MQAPAQLLGTLPESLRDELYKAYSEIERNFRERRWEPSELNGGKLCEVIYSIVKGYIDSNYPYTSTKPSNMVEACRNLEQSPSLFPRSFRIQIPRMLICLYEIRNNRGVGHIGGDVDPNEMDATCVLQMSKWLVAELIRAFHNTSIESAQRAVDSLSERDISLVWQVGETKRILDPNMSRSDQTLLLLYSSSDPLTEQDLLSHVEYSNASVYRREVLRKLHKKRFVEFNENNKLVVISPLGIAHVESVLLPPSA